jgi:hypothetical protein
MPGLRTSALTTVRCHCGEILVRIAAAIFVDIVAVIVEPRRLTLFAIVQFRAVLATRHATTGAHAEAAGDSVGRVVLVRLRFTVRT